MTNIFIKPASADAVVRQPDRDMRPLSADGEWVVDSEFWKRRIMHGDVVLAEPPKAEAPKKAPPEPAKE